MRALYTAAIRGYGLVIHIASLFHAKAKKWIQGRYDQSKNNKIGLEKCIWIHCASLGEFEQGRPVLEKLKSAYPDIPILLTFYSPSGYEIRKKYPLADAIEYLPLDTPENARALLQRHNPLLAIFVKYEVWHNLFRELFRQGIPTLMISAKFRKDQIYFKPWGAWFQKSLRGVNHIFTQDSTSEKLLNNIGIVNTSTSGDTRFDRVIEIAKSSERIEAIENLVSGKITLIAGSTWGPDEDLLADFFRNSSGLPELQLIIVPHEISHQHINRLTNLLPECQIWSLHQTQLKSGKPLIIDTIGLLSKLYLYADIAYIGGGFGVGIHNVLEPAAFGVPVVFGPKYHKFTEARNLIEKGGGWSVSNKRELTDLLTKLLNDKDLLNQGSKAAKDFVADNAGATNVICDHIDRVIGKKF